MSTMEKIGFLIKLVLIMIGGIVLCLISLTEMCKHDSILEWINTFYTYDWLTLSLLGFGVILFLLADIIILFFNKIY